jgi:hypothetical protein
VHGELNNKLRFFSPRFLAYAALALISLFGIMVVFYATRWGAALSDDSYYYVSSARNLLAGHGFDLVPIFPPLLPLLLSLVGLFKVDPLTSIRWINALLFGLNIYLVGRIIYTLTRSYLFALSGALLAFVSSTLIMVHSWAMSEPLFISLALCGILIYSTGKENMSWKVPLLTGLFWGLSAATRYVGVAFLLAGGIFWISEGLRSNQQRIRNTIVFSAVGLTPLLAWLIRNEIITGKPTNRIFSLHLVPQSSWINLVNTILLWILPGRFVHGKEILWLAGLILVIVAWFVFTVWRNKTNLILAVQSIVNQKPVILLALCITTYLVILIFSRSFLDERIPMDERLLSPLLIFGLILLIWILNNQWNKKKWFKLGILMILGLAFLITNGSRSVQMVQSYHEVGRGYASRRDHISETYAYLRKRPDIPIYSNAFAALYFWIDRVTYALPSPSKIPAMKEDMRRSGAYLVIFNSIPVELYGTTRDELTQGLIEQIVLSEATIYRAP